MNRHLLLLALSLVFVSSLHAQPNAARNCSAITFENVGATVGAKTCSAFYFPSTENYPYTFKWKINCYLTSNYFIYYTFPDSLTAQGDCGVISKGTTDCPPKLSKFSLIIPATVPGRNNLYFYTSNGFLGNAGCAFENGPSLGASCMAENCQGGSSPILMDLDGSGFHLTDVSDGVTFDIAGNGKPVKMAWTAKGSNTAFLALPNADGRVVNGNQLFGNQHAANGFLELAVYDDPKNGGNGDAIIDNRDGIWSSLRACTDKNHNGIFELSECLPLDSAGVNSISLHYKKDPYVDQYGNAFEYRTRMNPDHPDQVDHTAYDVFFVTDCP